MIRKSAANDLDFTRCLTGTYDGFAKAVVACSIDKKTLQEYFPGSAGALCSGGAVDGGQSKPTLNFFVFYQHQGCWAWKRVDEQENVIAQSGATFMLYSDCVADARRHGWKGKPLALFLPNKRRK